MPAHVRHQPWRPAAADAPSLVSTSRENVLPCQQIHLQDLAHLTPCPFLGWLLRYLVRCSPPLWPFAEVTRHCRGGGSVSHWAQPRARKGPQTPPNEHPRGHVCAVWASSGSCSARSHVWQGKRGAGVIEASNRSRYSVDRYAHTHHKHAGERSREAQPGRQTALWTAVLPSMWLIPAQFPVL